MEGRGEERDDGEVASLLARSLHELALEHQPQVCLQSGGISGAEALVRWNRGGEKLEAAAFVPHARAAGVLPAIDDWVACQADGAAARFRDVDPTFRMWVNASPDDLVDGRLLRRMSTCVRAPANFGVEVTEDAVMGDLQAAVRALRTVRELGVCVALDDFGTGHSSLAQLKRLPIDVVKIDRTFTAGLPWDKHDRYLVEAVLHLAMRFKFEVVAEGIERVDQAEWLRHAGCDFAQGYLFGRPMPAEQLEAAIRLQDGTPARRATTPRSSTGQGSG